MSTKFNHKEEEDEDTMLLDSLGNKAYLIIHNDDHNTFDWVIQSLIDVCGHTNEQSEQLALLIHYKGKATVKTGEMEILKPMKDALIDRGLSAVIETEVESQ
jgi:ATP-dependent Clp protease adaptor protein ClpS